MFIQTHQLVEFSAGMIDKIVPFPNNLGKNGKLRHNYKSMFFYCLWFAFKPLVCLAFDRSSFNQSETGESYIDSVSSISTA